MSSSQDSSLKRTPLYEQHRALGARMVEFGGWEMPVQYKSIIEEHQAVRSHAGLFDVSHMGEFKVEGNDAQAFLQYLVPNDVARLQDHQALYTHLCLPDGNVIDDLLIYRLADQHYLLVVNAGNIAKDFAWVANQASQHFQHVQVTNQSETTALLALQGPLAEKILQPLVDLDLSSINYYHCASGSVGSITCLISRTGYTGEDGFELYCASSDAPRLWQILLEQGAPSNLSPAGLGARDTLRLEAGLCLYEHELDEQTNPLEARLGWTVKFKSGNFIGREALLQVKAQGPRRLLVGIELIERGVPRSGYPIYSGEHRVGTLTSGTYGPTVGKSIGMGYVDAHQAIVDQSVQVEIRGKRVAARIVPLPFYKRQS